MRCPYFSEVHLELPAWARVELGVQMSQRFIGRGEYNGVHIPRSSPIDDLDIRCEFAAAFSGFASDVSKYRVAGEDWYGIGRIQVYRPNSSTVVIRDISFSSVICSGIESPGLTVPIANLSAGMRLHDADTISFYGVSDKVSADLASRPGWIALTNLSFHVDPVSWTPQSVSARAYRRSTRSNLRTVTANSMEHYHMISELVEAMPFPNQDSSENRNSQVAFMWRTFECASGFGVLALDDRDTAIAGMYFMRIGDTWHNVISAYEPSRVNTRANDRLYTDVIVAMRQYAYNHTFGISWGLARADDVGLCRMKRKYSTSVRRSIVLHDMSRLLCVE